MKIQYNKNISYFLNLNTYENNKKQKKEKIDYLNFLTSHHYINCKEYKKIIDIKTDKFKITSINDLPYIPTGLFKNFDLRSVPRNKIYKTLYSSGTSNQTPSKIFLDKFTSSLQSKVLIKSFNYIFGIERMPMIIIDNNDSINSSSNFSARGAGIAGFSIFSTERHYVLDNNMNLIINKIKKLSNKKNKKYLIFGFTYVVWKSLLNYLKKNKLTIDLSSSILVHGGGWKKLEELNISNIQFKKEIKKYLNIKKVFNYYGMVEQTGSIYFECEKGFFHTSIFNDVIIRDKNNLKILKKNNSGLVQAISLIPHSYPGHSILTDDLGEIYGEDTCKCGLHGKYFKIYGRNKNAEIRGCSNVIEN
tara:strand:- start:1480 stop:2562 length:1083 start_codon:yes stop_codon:yes gene_type:complete